MFTYVILHKRKPVWIENFSLSSCLVGIFTICCCSGNTVPYLLEYKTTLYIRLPLSESVFGKVPIQNVFNFVHDYKVTTNFSDDATGKKNLSYIRVHIISYNCKWNNLNLFHTDTQAVIKPCLKDHNCTIWSFGLFFQKSSLKFSDKNFSFYKQ